MCQRKIRSIGLFLVGAVLCQSEPSSAESFKPTDVHAAEEPFAETAAQTLDTAPMNQVLQKHLHDGRIDFRALKKDEAARKDLQSFLDAIAVIPESEPLSSWINTYNLLVIDAVLQRYPLVSFTDVPEFFSKIKYPVAGKQRSMDMENCRSQPCSSGSKMTLSATVARFRVGSDNTPNLKL